MTPRERAENFAIAYATARRLEGEIISAPHLRMAVHEAIAAAVEEEREACAKIAQDHIPGLLEYDSIDDGGAYKSVTAAGIRDKIRNRRNKPDGGAK